MTKDEILDIFDRTFGAGKYPRGPAIAAGEELVGAGRREAALMQRAVDSATRLYAGESRYGERVFGATVSEVAAKLVVKEQDGYAPSYIRDMRTFQFHWQRDNDATALFELQLLAGITPQRS